MRAFRKRFKSNIAKYDGLRFTVLNAYPKNEHNPKAGTLFVVHLRGLGEVHAYEEEVLEPLPDA